MISDTLLTATANQAESTTFEHEQSQGSNDIKESTSRPIPSTLALLADPYPFIGIAIRIRTHIRISLRNISLIDFLIYMPSALRLRYTTSSAQAPSKIHHRKQQRRTLE
jgi:hypothetical protein